MWRQSWPRAGSWILRKVMGHFRDTLMAVCSTPSSPLRPGVPGMVPLLKLRFTDVNRERTCQETIPSRGVWGGGTSPRGQPLLHPQPRRAALTLADAVLRRQEALLEEALQD